MGKCKRRTMHKANSSYFMTRQEAINDIFKTIKNSKEKAGIKNVLKTISLFGISTEELSEAGLPYENIKALESATDD